MHGCTLICIGNKQQPQFYEQLIHKNDVVMQSAKCVLIGLLLADGSALSQPCVTYL